MTPFPAPQPLLTLFTPALHCHVLCFLQGFIQVHLLYEALTEDPHMGPSHLLNKPFEHFPTVNNILFGHTFSCPLIILSSMPFVFPQIDFKVLCIRIMLTASGVLVNVKQPTP